MSERHLVGHDAPAFAVEEAQLVDGEQHRVAPLRGLKLEGIEGSAARISGRRCNAPWQ
ncbi:MAG: hypothetical protein WDN69_00345 [Aliidongia sp.]